MGRKKDIIDLGEWTVPTSWDEVTLKMYQDIERMYEDKDKPFDVRECLHIFCGRSVDEINELPVEFAESIMSRLSFLQEKPDDGVSSNSVVISGETYIVKFMEKLKVGEYVAVDTIIKGDKHNYAAILAILCRKDDEAYDSRFEAEVLEGRIRMFEEQPITVIMPLISFFLDCYMVSVVPSLLSSRIREEIDHTLRHIETSVTSGEVSRRSMKSAMKRLRKLERSLNSI